MATKMTVDELREASDLDLGSSKWFEVTQEMIDQFADATHDHQWIHVDKEKAEAGPFGTRIAHGYLTVALLPEMLGDVLEVEAQMGVNYGIDKLRLTSPVPSGSRVRVNAKLASSEPKGEGVLYRVDVEVEIEDGDRPALVGTCLYLVYP